MPAAPPREQGHACAFGSLRIPTITSGILVGCGSAEERIPMGDFFDNWTVQVRKGLIELCVLDALAGRERYGYELVKALVDIPGLGVTEGTLYPLLSRLRLQGLVRTRLEESPEGPARKYYALTEEGWEIRAQMKVYLDELNDGMRLLRERGSDHEHLDSIRTQRTGATS